MKDLNKLNRIKRKVIEENPIALCVATLENGDMEYRTQLKDGTTVDFYIPKEKTFVRAEKLKTQEFSKNIVRHIKEK